jgi:hypothetical protein
MSGETDPRSKARQAMRSRGLDGPYRELISQARAGDRNAALRLLRDLRDAARSPDLDPVGRKIYAIRPELMKYLVRCLSQLLDGADPRVAFNLGRSNHRPPATDREQRELSIAARFLRHRKEGLSREDALRRTGKEFIRPHIKSGRRIPLGPKAVEAAVRRWTVVDERGNHRVVFGPRPSSKHEKPPPASRNKLRVR